MTAERVFIRVNSADGVVTSAGREKCPVCGSTAPLVFLIDSDDWSTDPVDVLCSVGHSWPAAGVERWMLAQVIVHARVAEPGLDDMVRRLGHTR